MPRRSYSREEMYKIEYRIIKEVQQIKLNADSYGDEVEIVAKRAVLAHPDKLGLRGNGYEYEYKLSDGRVVNNDYAWELANAGKIKNVIGSHNRGRKYVRSVGDGRTENNLGAIPRFFN